MADLPTPTLLGTCRIEAGRKWNLTGLILHAGHHYVFAPEPDQTWRDASITCGPAGYQSQGLIFRLFQSWRRSPGDCWFSLIGALDQDLSSRFLIGNGCEIPAMPVGGELCCFANDVGFMYWNNHDAITLKVYERIAPAASAMPVPATEK
jgi:hypothetical protein